MQVEEFWSPPVQHSVPSSSSNSTQESLLSTQTIWATQPNGSNSSSCCWHERARSVGSAPDESGWPSLQMSPVQHFDDRAVTPSSSGSSGLHSPDSDSHSDMVQGLPSSSGQAFMLVSKHSPDALQAPPTWHPSSQAVPSAANALTQQPSSQAILVVHGPGSPHSAAAVHGVPIQIGPES